MQTKYTMSDLETSISKDHVAAQHSPALCHLLQTLLKSEELAIQEM